MKVVPNLQLVWLSEIVREHQELDGNKLVAPRTFNYLTFGDQCVNALSSDDKWDCRRRQTRTSLIKSRHPQQVISQKLYEQSARVLMSADAQPSLTKPRLRVS